MLHEFLVANRDTLIERCRAKVAARRAPRPTPAELEFGIPLFLTQLTSMLAEQRAYATDGSDKEFASERDGSVLDAATKHGDELRRHGFTIDQVVHDYGDLCQSITRLAAEKDAPVTVHEFGLMNIKLDNAIAGAVTEYTRLGIEKAEQETSAVNKANLGTLAHEMRNRLNTAILAITAMKTGTVGFSGATAGALDRSLIGMRDLIDRTLAEIRLEEPGKSFMGTVELASFITEVQVSAALEAASRGCELSVAPVARGIYLEADAHMLGAALANLLQNAFKFTHAHSHVQLRAYARDGSVFIEVEDECGGLPQGDAEAIFRPFKQSGSDRTGVGLGLSISRKAVEASGGTLNATNIPGRGCVLRIVLPEKRPRTTSGAA